MEFPRPTSAIGEGIRENLRQERYRSLRVPDALDLGPLASGGSASPPTVRGD